MDSKIEFTRINNDVNGNPRYVCHFLNIVNEKDEEQAKAYGIGYISELYKTAVKKAKKIGGAKYKGKDYGGGIVFQSYNTDMLDKFIKEVQAK